MNTYLQIDLSKLRQNLACLRKIMGRKKIMAVVKADAYGHGLLRISRALIQENIDYLGISRIEEAQQIRKISKDVPLLLLSSIDRDVVSDILAYNITPTVYSPEVARLLDKEARARSRRIKIHIKIDTGMGRLGLWYKYALEGIKEILGLGGLQLEGIYTHFADSRDDEDYTRVQLSRFTELLSQLASQGINPRLAHIANSAAIFRYPEAHLDLVRPGLAIYGIEVPDRLGIHPVMSFKTHIAHINRCPEGRTIGYARTYTTSRFSKIAIIPVGYAQGYPYSLSNYAYVLVRARQCPVIGRICMDQTFIDVTELKEVEIGDEVVLFGSQGGKEISIEDLATWAETITYELLCRLPMAIPRDYIGE